MFRALVLGLLFGAGPFANAGIAGPLRQLPVQDAGRVKPYDTFAREALEMIHGKSTYKGKAAVEVVTTWMLIPEDWDGIDFIEVRHSGLREALQLAHEKIYFSPKDMISNLRLPLVLQELRTVREGGDKLNPYFQEVQRLENQITLYQAIRMGMALRLVPQIEKDQWLSVSELTEPAKSQFAAIMSRFAQGVAAEVDKAKGPEATGALSRAVEEFVATARSAAPEMYASDFAIRAEVHYNSFHPFKWAWVAYLLSAVFFIAHMVNGRLFWTRWGWLAGAIGLGLHTYGMGLRVYLAGRPPVSNMYETVVWVAWGTLFFGLLLFRQLKSHLILVAAAMVAILCLILTDLAPTVLDASIHPLEPVLRSTFWLSTHVTIITVSYAAFFLAFALGDWVLFLALRDEKKYAAQIAAGANAIYRAIQIGVVLLAVGIILGGVWADYSWGRFWGWDPKETWALIALLGYVALLHARLVGWARQFGTAASAVVAFSLVIMAWYGVNFVLGAGLHSYGFGAGGVEYVSAFVAFHLLYVAFVTGVRWSRKRRAK